MNILNNESLVLIFIITLTFSFLFTFVVKKLAFHVGALDMPNERKVHKKPMPRLGGLAIFSSFLLGLLIHGNLSEEIVAILIGAFIIVIVGIFDDIKPVKARYKIIFQVIASFIVIYFGNIYIDEISLLGWVMTFNYFWSFVISMAFMLGITNSINLIDGLDGLAAGVSTIYFGTILVIATILNMFGGLDILICVIMLGATLGFLVHNFPPAKIFMGDVGSLFLGYIISVVALLGFKITTITTLFIPILILAIPIFDTLLAIFRRLLNHKSLGEADKEHFHHQLLKLKFTNKASILIIYAINIMFASVSVFYILGDGEIAMSIYIILMILLLFVVLKTNILFAKKENKIKKIKK